MDNDPSRTSKHYTIIIKYHQLARYLKMQGKSVEWRDILGYVEDGGENRKKNKNFLLLKGYLLT